MTTIDYKLISELQLKFISQLLSTNLGSFERIKFARSLIANYKKAKRILKSGIQVDGDWESVLELTKEGLNSFVQTLVDLTYENEEDIQPSIWVAYVELLSQIQFLDYEDETIYKEQDNSTLVSEINFDLFKDMI